MPSNASAEKYNGRILWYLYSKNVLWYDELGWIMPPIL
jgi:hypothetical protein